MHSGNSDPYLLTIQQKQKCDLTSIRKFSHTLSGKSLPVQTDNRYTVAYARVSSHGQKEDLRRQAQVLELFCAEHGYEYEMITDLGSGMNYYKKGLTSLINKILNNELNFCS